MNYRDVLFLIGPFKAKLPLFAIAFLTISFLDIAGLSAISLYFSTISGSADNRLFNLNTQEIFRYFGVYDNDVIIVFAFVLLFIFIFKFMVGLYLNFSLIKFSQKLQFYLRSKLVENYSGMEFKDFIFLDSSTAIYSIHRLTENFSNRIVLLGLRFFGEGIVVLIICIFLAIENFIAFSLLLLLFGATLVFYQITTRKSLKNWGSEANQISIDMVQSINDFTRGFIELRILGKQETFASRVLKQAQKLLKIQTNYLFISSIPKYLIELIIVFFIVFFVILSDILNLSYAEIISTLTIFGLAGIRMTQFISSASNFLVQINFGKNAVLRLKADFHLKNDSSTQLRSITTEKEQKFQSLRLSKINYNIDGKDVLKNFDFSISAKEVVGLTGPSGSGKTTIINILLGFLKPNSGQVLYNEGTVKDKLSDLWSKTAYLAQTPFFINAPIWENITLEANYYEIDRNRLKQALKNSGLEEWINTLPDGTSTEIGEYGTRVSGGQKQRISIARALYHRREFLILDEPTSALDRETEVAVFSEIKRASKDLTILVVSHSESIDNFCDRVLKIEALEE